VTERCTAGRKGGRCRCATSRSRHEPAAPARWLDGTGISSSASGFAQRAFATSRSRECRPQRSRLIHRVAHHAPAPGSVAQASRRWDRGLASLAGRPCMKGVLTSRCTGQARTVVDVAAWRDPLGSTIITPGEPALAGELCVSVSQELYRQPMWEGDVGELFALW
jgi:hypothetical protein